MADIIQIRRDTGANWYAENPTLADGELAIETDATPAQKMKIGNGVDDWRTLPNMFNDGSRIYSGSSAPSTLYNDHDYYIRTTNGYLYEQQSSAWVYIMTLGGSGGTSNSDYNNLFLLM